jgi:hypothetical protein
MKLDKLEKMLNRMGFPGQTARLGTLVRALRRDTDIALQRVTIAEDKIVELDADKMDKSYLPELPGGGIFTLKCLDGVITWTEDH